MSETHLTPQPTGSQNVDSVGQAEIYTLLRAIVLLGVIFAPLSLLLDTYVSALLITCGVVLVLVASRLSLFNHNRLLHLTAATMAAMQFCVVDFSRTETHIGVAWFLAIPFWAALLGRRQHVWSWFVGSCVLIILCWYRASPDDLLWQHPMTLPNLLGIATLTTCISARMVSGRDNRVQSLSKAVEQQRVNDHRLQDAESSERETRQLNRRIISSLSHDLKTPLTGIRLLTDELNQKKTTTQAAGDETLQLLTRITESAQCVLEDLIALSRLSPSETAERSTCFQLVPLLEEAAAMVKAQADSAQTELVVDVRPSVAAEWYGDAVFLRQVVMNVLANAVRCTHHGNVRILVTPDKLQCLQVLIQHNGQRLSASDAATLFTPVADSTDGMVQPDSVRQGMGLGLSIAHDMVVAMNGKLAVDLMDNSVTSFRIRVPFRPVAGAPVSKCYRHIDMSLCHLQASSTPPWAEERIQAWYRNWNADLKYVEIKEGEHSSVLLHDTTHREVHSRLDAFIAVASGCVPGMVISKPKLPSGSSATDANTTSSATSSQSSVRGLIVEDNPLVLQVLTTVAGSIGLESLSASNGNEALTILDNTQIDVVLMDINMPGSSGLQTLRTIRSSGKNYQNLPVYLMSGAEGMEAECIQAGATAFLKKPLCRESLLRVLECDVDTPRNAANTPDRD